MESLANNVGSLDVYYVINIRILIKEVVLLNALKKGNTDSMVIAQVAKLGNFVKIAKILHSALSAFFLIFCFMVNV